MVNSELFRQIADRIEKEPHLHDQEYSARDPSPKCGEMAACIFCFAEEILGLPHNGSKYINNRMMPASASIDAMGLNDNDAYTLYHWGWKPRPDLTVPEALRLIADGKSVSEVSA